jgi:Cytochrome bd terminal oxidase subunit I
LSAVRGGRTVIEIGRQPHVVYGLLRTADAAAPVAVRAVTTSLVLFVIVYTVLLIAFFSTPRARNSRACGPTCRSAPQHRLGAGQVSGGVRTMDLPLALGLVVAFGIAMYVVMDSFDLGVGILFPFAPAETDRDLMMNRGDLG